jgi:hypothetical protein
MSQITEFICQYKKNWKVHVDRIPKNNSKIPTKREKKFRKTFEKMEGFSFITPVTGLNRLNTGKNDDDEVGLYRRFYIPISSTGRNHSNGAT